MTTDISPEAVRALAERLRNLGFTPNDYVFRDACGDAASTLLSLLESEEATRSELLALLGEVEKLERELADYREPYRVCTNGCGSWIKGNKHRCGPVGLGMWQVWNEP